MSIVIKVLNKLGIKTKAQKKREVAVARLKMMSEQDKVVKKVVEVRPSSNIIDLQAVAKARTDFEMNKKIEKKNGGRK